jgi:methanogenic corrinoid protein MtbC1
MGRFIGWLTDSLQVNGNSKAAMPGGGDCAAPPTAAVRLDQLMKTIEGEIIPRLVLAHRGAPVASPAADADVRVSADQVLEFAEILLTDDLEAPRRFVDGLQGAGVPLESIYLELFSPAARRLGDMWSTDLCDFTAVTLGLWRLQRLLYDCAPGFQVDSEAPAEGRRILLVPMPGEQHTFGLFMVAEFFRRAGWDVVDGPVVSPGDVVSAVSRHWFEVVGLSLSCDRGLDALAALIREVRRASRNRGIGIIVGGTAFAEHPDAVLRVDADVAAADAREALAAAQDLLFANSARQRATRG